jgi:hypothetical protein
MKNKVEIVDDFINSFIGHLSSKEVLDHVKMIREMAYVTHLNTSKFIPPNNGTQKRNKKRIK